MKEVKRKKGKMYSSPVFYCQLAVNGQVLSSCPFYKKKEVDYYSIDVGCRFLGSEDSCNSKHSMLDAIEKTVSKL